MKSIIYMNGSHRLIRYITLLWQLIQNVPIIISFSWTFQISDFNLNSSTNSKLWFFLHSWYKSQIYELTTFKRTNTNKNNNNNHTNNPSQNVHEWMILQVWNLSPTLNSQYKDDTRCISPQNYGRGGSFKFLHEQLNSYKWSFTLFELGTKEKVLLFLTLIK